MPLEFIKPERISLKSHTEFTEKRLQQRIKDDPGLLGLGDDVALLDAERIQHRAGRLDLLLHDEQLNRRYEVELMLGASDPSHIIRSIEYWDIERRRYPAYDHVAVLVAEDKRFNDIGQLATPRRGNKAVAVSFKPQDFDSQRELLKQFLNAALNADGAPGE